MASDIMVIDILFSSGKDACEANYSPDQKYLKEINHAKSLGKVRELVSKINAFYTYLRRTIENHDEEIKGLDDVAKDKLRKIHWGRLNKIKDEAKELIMFLPENVYV